MDTPTPVNPTPTQTPMQPAPVSAPISAPAPQRKSNMMKYLLIAGLTLVAVVSVAASMFLTTTPSTDNRGQAATTLACAGSSTVAGSACNEKCYVNDDCTSGLFCNIPTGQTEGVCRLSAAPDATTCVAPTPLACASGRTCTFNYDCNLSVGEACVGSNANNGSGSITAQAPRAATAAELSSLASNQTISMTSGTTFTPDANGRVQFSVVSKKATTFFIRVFNIVAAKGGLDPQQGIMTQTFSIGANQVVSGVVTLPRCGRYQIDFGSAVVTGTKYDLNSVAHYFWGGIYEIPCQNGCCGVLPIPTALPGVAGTSSVSSPTNASALSTVALSIVDATTIQQVSTYASTGTTVAVTKSLLPARTAFLATIFPNQVTSGLVTYTFEVNGKVMQSTGSPSYEMAMPVGSYIVKVTPSTVVNGQPVVGTPKSVTFTIK